MRVTPTPIPPRIRQMNRGNSGMLLESDSSEPPAILVVAGVFFGLTEVEATGVEVDFGVGVTTGVAQGAGVTWTTVSALTETTHVGAGVGVGVGQTPMVKVPPTMSLLSASRHW